jgi:hypothetical protein
LSRAGLVLGILATLAANVAAGAHFGIFGGLVNAWPAIAFIVASEILLRMLRAARDLPSADAAVAAVAAVVPTAPASVPGTVADAAPGETAESGPTVSENVPGGVPRVVPVKARGQARRRSPKQSAPERVFVAEIEVGQLPSLRSIKARMHVGTDRARIIRDHLAEILQEVPEAA